MVARAYKQYLLVVLLIILASNYVDRLALGLLLQEIKTDLALTDTQLGFLSGIAFALFYAVMGIPIARWADRGNRVTIIALTAALWGIAVSLCGVATSFIQLLIIRVVIGIGEAGCKPPALSLISDYFSRAERPKAVSRYMLGYPLALVVGNLSAGWLNELYGWRVTFVILGVPGVLLSVLAWLTLREPRRHAGLGAPLEISQTANSQTANSQTTTASPTQDDFKTTIRALWCNRAFRHVLVCFSLVSFFSYGITLWLPGFFVRSHGFSTGELGTWLAVAYGVGGGLGTVLGGLLATRYAANNEGLQLKYIAVLYAVLAVLKACVYIAPDRYSAFAIFTMTVIGGAMGNGPIYAATQTLVPAQMRAMSIAVVLFFSNLLGAGFGPLTVGLLSDVLRPMVGEESLRYGLLVLCPGYFWAARHAWMAGRVVLHEATGAADLKRLASSKGAAAVD
jgi:MFS transporter, Spinster family, sphingosine-1-phosphate transporter